MKHKLYLVILLLFFCFRVSGFDTSSVVLNAKISIYLLHRPNWTKADLVNALNSECSFTFLESRGFRDLVFFKITLKPKSQSSDEFNNMVGYFTNETFDYVFGYNLIGGQIYSFKGLKHNDFKRLFMDLKLYSSSSFLKSRKMFCEYYFIEGIDLDCLYRSIKYKSKRNLGCLEVGIPKQYNIW